MSSGQTTGEVRPDDEQFGPIPSLIWGCSRCAHFLRTGAFNREVSALAKNVEWEHGCIRTGAYRGNPRLIVTALEQAACRWDWPYVFRSGQWGYVRLKNQTTKRIATSTISGRTRCFMQHMVYLV